MPLHCVRSVSARLPAARLDEASETDPSCLRTDLFHPKKPKRVRASVKSPKVAKETVDGLSRLLQARSKLVESPFHRETSRRSGA